MKIRKFTSYCFTFLILNADAFTQSINDFEDFPWCSSQKDVRKLMLESGQIKLNSDGKDFIVFENRKFGDYAVKYWSYRFYNDSLYSVIIVMDSITREDILKIENLKKFIKEGHITRFGNSILKLDYTWLLSDSLGNLIGIIEIDANPSSSFGSRIRVIFRYYPLLIRMIEQNKFYY